MAQLSLSFLGAFQATLGQQHITHFRSANVEGMLVYLAMQADRPFSRDVLATLFWPDETENATRANLRQSLYQLRKVLQDNEQERPFLLINRHTVQFNPNSDYECDVQQFLTALAQRDWAAAVTYYTGELLPGFTCDSPSFEEWLLHQREQLHRQALEALSDWTEELLADGRFYQAQSMAQRQLELEPWREKGHQQLMHSLVLNGERTAALAQYETCCRLLADELGTEPSSETTDLAQRIIIGEISPLLPQPATLLISPPHNLLAPTTTYFGRIKEQADLIKQLPQPEHRLITLVGEGGIGKSRLAQEVAWQLREAFHDGVWFVPLAGLSPQTSEIAGTSALPDLQATIATTIAQAMNHTLGGQQSPQIQLQTFLKDRQSLLILDNFEHLLAAAELVLNLLQHAPNLTLLCTSREPLGFMAEWVYQLEQLPMPPPPPTDPTHWLKTVEVDIASYTSVKLFVDRARRADGRFRLTPNNENEIAHLCRLVSGIPLGLELAAAALRQQPLPQLITIIEASLDGLAIRLRDVPQRHRSLRAVFETSWDLLTSIEQELFASLSIFRGGFEETAAYFITQATPHQLQSLTDKSLLQYRDHQRFHIQEHLRQFAAEKLAILPYGESVPLKHSAYYLNLIAQKQAALVGEEPQTAVNLLSQELDNIRQAWQTAVAHQQTQTLTACLLALADFYQIRGLYREAVHQFQHAISQFTNPSLLTHLLTHQSLAYIRLSQYTNAASCIQRALILAEQINDKWIQSKLHIYWGELLWRQGDLTEAETKLNHAKELAEEINSRSLTGSTLFHLGIVYDYKGNLETAMGYLESALVIWRLLGNQRQQGFTLNSVGIVAHRLGYLADKAKAALTEALAISQANNDLQGQSMTLNNLSLLAIEQQAHEAAKSYLAKALQLAEHVGDKHGQALLTYNLGWNAYKAQWLQEAQQYADLSLNLSRQIGDQSGESRTLQLHGDLEIANGRLSHALICYQSALTILQKIGATVLEKEMAQTIEDITQQLEQQRQVQSSPLLS